MTILLVDDEPEYRLIMKNVLSGEGWDVLLAENGQEALERLKEHSVDVVVSDIYMPVMDGIKLHRTVRALPQFESLPFLFVSAYDDQHTLDAVKDPRFEGFVRKTRPVEEILEWITFLATPEEQRPKSPPTPLPLKGKSTRRGDSSTPIY
ncbi:MAG: response regulator [Bacteroidetes bacterium]|nr:response regulator [Bacteroidota bacterium]